MKQKERSLAVRMRERARAVALLAVVLSVSLVVADASAGGVPQGLEVHASGFRQDRRTGELVQQVVVRLPSGVRAQGWWLEVLELPPGTIVAGLDEEGRLPLRPAADGTLRAVVRISNNRGRPLRHRFVARQDDSR